MEASISCYSHFVSSCTPLNSFWKPIPFQVLLPSHLCGACPGCRPSGLSGEMLRQRHPLLLAKHETLTQRLLEELTRDLGSAKKTKGCRGSWQFSGGWNGQVKGCKDIHPFLSFSCQTLKSSSYYSSDARWKKILESGCPWKVWMGGMGGFDWFQIPCEWLNRSHSERKGMIIYQMWSHVIMNHWEARSISTIATRLIKTGNYGRIMDWPEWHNVLPGFFGSVAMVHQFRHYFRVPWIMRLLSYELGQVSEPATSLWTFFSRGTWKAQQRL